MIVARYVPRNMDRDGQVVQHQLKVSANIGGSEVEVRLVLPMVDALQLQAVCPSGCEAFMAAVLERINSEPRGH